jgi:hypothetical protein
VVVISRWRAVVTVFGPGRDYSGWQRQLRSVAPLVPLRLDHCMTFDDAQTAASDVGEWHTAVEND